MQGPHARERDAGGKGGSSLLFVYDLFVALKIRLASGLQLASEVNDDSHVMEKKQNSISHYI